MSRWKVAMSRWKVAQHIHYRTWLAYPAYYDADQPHNDMDDDKPRTPRARAFHTWREAMDYADRMARTREVVLPRQQLPLSLPGLEEGERVFVTYDIEDGSVYLVDQDDGDTVVLYKHELRTLALALLAHEEQEEA